jgi:hypothetical protein
MSPVPTRPGYYWAKLKTPSGGNFYCEGIPAACQGMRIEPEGKSWESTQWEIVEVNENDPFGDPAGDEYFSVNVFGIPVTQWIADFYWGPSVLEGPPA